MKMWCSIDLNDVFQEAGGKVEERTRNFLVILTIRVQQPGIEETRNQIVLPKLHFLYQYWCFEEVPKVYNKNNSFQKFPIWLGFRFGQLLWFVWKPVHLMAGPTAVAEEFVVFCYNRHCPRPQGGCWGQWWHCAASENYLVFGPLTIIHWVEKPAFLENDQQPGFCRHLSQKFGNGKAGITFGHLSSLILVHPYWQN